MTNQEIDLQKQVDYFANLARSKALTDILNETLSRMKLNRKTKVDYKVEMEAIKEFADVNEYAINMITSDMKYILNDTWIKLQSNTGGGHVQLQAIYKVTFKDGSTRWNNKTYVGNTYPELIKWTSFLIDFVEEIQKESAKISLTR